MKGSCPCKYIMIIKILSSVLILLALYMGIKQGWAMLSGKPEMVDMFNKWSVGKLALSFVGAVTIIGAVLILFPQTFLWGNFISAAVILLIICFHLNETSISTAERLKGVAIELPFLLLSLIIIYLQHPFSKNIG